MRWRGHRESTNVEDRRGSGFRGPVGRGGSIGIGAIVVAFVAAWLLGVDPGVVLGVLEGGGPAAPPTSQRDPAQAPSDEGGRFTSVVLASTEDTWTKLFAAEGGQYRPPRLVLFDGRVNTACGLGAAATGPFYCPGDQRLYIDLGFFRLLQERLGAPGDFAQAYVIAHEVGHHVQNLTGTMQQVQNARQRMGAREYNALSVLLELQADCYAGVWANHSQQARNWLERGDIEEGMAAAAAVGDDRIQKQTQGVVVPESFTHGSSEQRMRWFRTGLESGDPQRCDTFSAAR